jgi:Zn-finger nucleic acid-binding protein
MDDVRIELTCPGCEERFLVAETQQGKIAECPSCGGWVDVPELGRLPNGFEAAVPTTQEQAQQWEESARQLEMVGRQLEQSQRALDHRDRQDARLDELLDRMDAVLGRWESLADRMARVIDRLDRSDGA